MQTDSKLDVGTYPSAAPLPPQVNLEEVAQQVIVNPIVEAVLSSTDGCVMVLNRLRQVVAANQRTLQLLNVSLGSALNGRRPGEALNCVNWRRGHRGCGSSDQCRHCGALTALLAAEVADKPVEGECTITKYMPRANEHFQCADYHVRITPFKLDLERGYVLVMNEVTNVKWRAIYERMFLHDVANLLSGLSGWAGEMVECPSVEIAQQVSDISKRLNEQLVSHRLLLKAEEGTPWLRPVQIDMPKIIQTLKSWFTAHECAKGRVFVIKYSNETPVDLRSDTQLLLRVLGNLITNAFEATPPLGAVTLTVSAGEDETVFDVHNPGKMDPDVVVRLFKTRFSSKGDGRGMGLKAVQIFGEHCLGGTVDFTTDVKFGTKFRFSLPNRIVTAES